VLFVPFFIVFILVFNIFILNLTKPKFTLFNQLTHLFVNYNNNASTIVHSIFGTCCRAYEICTSKEIVKLAITEQTVLEHKMYQLLVLLVN
jgi:hypothetical protein